MELLIILIKEIFMKNEKKGFDYVWVISFFLMKKELFKSNYVLKRCDEKFVKHT